MRRVVVVGGGVAGLSAGYRLLRLREERRLDLEVVVLEALGRAGGKILSERAGGVLFEGGPDSFVTAKPEALTLIRELGLGPRLLTADRKHPDVYVFARGKLRRLPEGLMLMAPSRWLPFLASDILTWRGKLRVAIEPWIPRGQARDESLADFTRRRLGAEALEILVDPVMAGIYAGDPERLSLRSSFPQIAEMEAKSGSVTLAMRRAAPKLPMPKGQTMFMSLAGGLEELSCALAEKIGPALRLNSPVSSIMMSGGRYRIVCGQQQPVEADAMILASPADKTASFVEGFDAELACELRRIPFASSATLSLLYDAEAAKGLPPGFGFVVARGEGKSISAATFTSWKFPARTPPDRFLIRCFLGGAGREEAALRADAELVKAAKADLREIIGLRAEALSHRLYRWTRANPQYNVGHADLIGRIERRLERYPQAVLAGASYYGVGIPDCIRSGFSAAEKVLS